MNPCRAHCAGTAGSRTDTPQAGFSLVELVVVMAVIGLLAVVAVPRFFGDSVFEERAYLDEIMARRYDETTPNGGVPPCAPCTPSGAFDDGEARADFDDVDDYDGVDDSPPLDAEGLPRMNYDGYRVQVAVAYPDPARVAALGLDDPSDAKIVTVTITRPAGTTMQFSNVRGNF